MASGVIVDEKPVVDQVCHSNAYLWDRASWKVSKILEQRGLFFLFSGALLRTKIGSFHFGKRRQYNEWGFGSFWYKWTLPKTYFSQEQFDG